MTSFIDNGIIYSKINNKWIVGTNSSISGNAVPSNQKAPSNLIIPKFVRGHKIFEIGSFAFRDHKEIISVNIYADLTQINHHSFSLCSGISFINIPSSVQYIFNFTLFFGIDNSIQSKIVTTVVFEQDSQLKFIDRYNFCSTKSITIYFCSSTNPTFITPIFQNVNDIIIYTTQSQNVFGKATKKDSNICTNLNIFQYFLYSKTCRINNKCISLFVLHFCIIISL